MRTWIILIFALIFGSIFYALEPQGVNEMFSNLFHRTRSAVVNTAHQVEGTVGLRSEYIQVDGHSLAVQVADSEAEWIHGLSGRTSLGANRGMLFVFPTAERYEFTMRGMRFPLDFVWFRSGAAIGFTENVPPPAGSEDPRTVPPPGPVDAVLELNAGTVHVLDLGVGAELVRPPA